MDSKTVIDLIVDMRDLYTEAEARIALNLLVMVVRNEVLAQYGLAEIPTASDEEENARYEDSKDRDRISSSKDLAQSNKEHSADLPSVSSPDSAADRNAHI